ncbi:unnamed protein product, partial [marine sediment metagenome]
FSQAPVTGPSCASFITGFLPQEVKVTENTMKLIPEDCDPSIRRPVLPIEVLYRDREKGVSRR